MHRRSRVFSALPLPMHAGSTVADPMASHTALNGAILSIEGARTHAHGISTGAVAVFRAFQRAQPGVDRSRAGAPDDLWINLPLATRLRPAVIEQGKRKADSEYY